MAPKLQIVPSRDTFNSYPRPVDINFGEEGDVTLTLRGSGSGPEADERDITFNAREWALIEAVRGKWMAGQ